MEPNEAAGSSQAHSAGRAKQPEPAHDEQPEDDAGSGDQSAPETKSSAPDQDSDDEMSSTEDQPALTWGLSGRKNGSYPRLIGDTRVALEYYTRFAATDPADERDDWLMMIDFEHVLELTPNLVLDSDIHLVLEPDDGANPLSTDYPYRGLWVKSLFLRYEQPHYSLFGGKYEPAGGIRGYAPIFFGNYSVDMNLLGAIGVGGSLTLAREGFGKHNLSGHVFVVDTLSLDGGLLTARGRRKNAIVGTTSDTPSYLVTLDGGTVASPVTFSYTLGAGVLRRGGALDEPMYLGALYHSLPLGLHRALELSVEFLHLRNVHGEAKNTSGIGLGVAYSGPRLGVGGAFWTRFVHPGGGYSATTDFVAEIVARYQIGYGISVESAYQNIKEGGQVSHAIGCVLVYTIDSLIY